MPQAPAYTDGGRVGSPWVLESKAVMLMLQKKTKYFPSSLHPTFQTNSCCAATLRLQKPCSRSAVQSAYSKGKKGQWESRCIEAWGTTAINTTVSAGFFWDASRHSTSGPVLLSVHKSLIPSSHSSSQPLLESRRDRLAADKFIVYFYLASPTAFSPWSQTIHS